MFQPNPKEPKMAAQNDNHPDGPCEECGSANGHDCIVHEQWAAQVLCPKCYDELLEEYGTGL
jgi:hypothetical protein